MLEIKWQLINIINWKICSIVYFIQYQNSKRINERKYTVQNTNVPKIAKDKKKKETSPTQRKRLKTMKEYARLDHKLHFTLQWIWICASMKFHLGFRWLFYWQSNCQFIMHASFARMIEIQMMKLLVTLWKQKIVIMWLKCWFIDTLLELNPKVASSLLICYSWSSPEQWLPVQWPASSKSILFLPSSSYTGIKSWENEAE